MSICEEYQEELRQRSRLAACARYRRGRRRGCSLPSDSLTPAQLRRRNGPVRVFRGGAEVTASPQDGAASGTASSAALVASDGAEGIVCFPVRRRAELHKEGETA